VLAGRGDCDRRAVASAAGAEATEKSSPETEATQATKALNEGGACVSTDALESSSIAIAAISSLRKGSR
jgi:hypothetical protein